MANVPAGNTPAPTSTPAPIISDQPATAISRADASEIVTLCLDGGVSAMASSLLREGVSVAEAKNRIAGAGKIKEAVALARGINPEIPENEADTFMAQGKSLDQVTAALFDRMVAKQDGNEVRSHVPLKTSDRPAATASMQTELQRAGLIKKGA